MPRVEFEQSGTVLGVDTPEGTSVLNTAFAHGVLIRSTCGGLAECLECRVRITSGAEHLSPPVERESRLLGPAALLAGERLACQARVLSGPVAVQIPRPPPQKALRLLR